MRSLIGLITHDFIRAVVPYVHFTKMLLHCRLLSLLLLLLL